VPAEVAEIRLMLRAMIDMNRKAGEYVQWLKEKTARIMSQSAATLRD
jgi:hypothetical protein